MYSPLKLLSLLSRPEAPSQKTYNKRALACPCGGEVPFWPDFDNASAPSPPYCTSCETDYHVVPRGKDDFVLTHFWNDMRRAA